MLNLMSLPRRSVCSCYMVYEVKWFINHCRNCNSLYTYSLLLFEVSAHYSADPYKMLDQLKKMNLKHVKVSYGVNKNRTTGKGKEEKKVLN